jgi:hypothetical protein
MKYVFGAAIIVQTISAISIKKLHFLRTDGDVARRKIYLKGSFYRNNATFTLSHLRG